MHTYVAMALPTTHPSSRFPPDSDCSGPSLEESTKQDNAVPLRLKCLFPFSRKSKSRYSELSFEKSIHPVKFMDLSFQVVPPLAVSQVTALYNPSLNNIHHDK
jgi:hypothetical protein